MANTPLDWTQYTEAVVGRNHPTLTDTDNRPLRELLTRSGFPVDQPFRGLPLGSSSVNAGSSDYSGTATARVTAAVADAVGAGLPFCVVPRLAWDGTAMTGFSGATFSTAVRMLLEGYNTFSYAVDAYGAAGDGTTDDTAAIKAAIAGAAGKAPVFGTPGKVYSVGNAYAGVNTPGDAATLLIVTGDNTILDFWGATLKYGGSVNDTNGSDSQGLSVVAFLGNNCLFRGTIDCNSKFRWGLGIQDTKKGLHFDCAILNCREPGWFTGFLPVQSIDVTGVGVTTRSVNYSGSIRRPSAPYMDNTSTITGHGDVTVELIGGSNVSGNSVGIALVPGQNGSGASNALLVLRSDCTGIPQFLFTGDHNLHFEDLGCHDLGADVAEIYGTSSANSSGFGMLNNDTLGIITKNATCIALDHGNAGSDGSVPSVVLVARNQGQAEIDFDYSSTQSGGRLIEKVTFPTFAAVFTNGIDCRNGNVFQVTVTANGTVAAPQLARRGQRVVYQLIQDGTGGRTIAWNAIFKVSWSDTGNTLNKRSSIAFIYDGTNWNQDGAQTPYV
jgi:hypothetical protein